MSITNMIYYVIEILMAILTIILCHKMQKATFLTKKGYWTRQIFLGLSMGLAACLEIIVGICASSLYVNCCDAIVLAAGLLFGSPAGIFAGIIGSIFHHITMVANGNIVPQMTTPLTTICAGVLAGLLRNSLFRDKVPTPIQAFVAGFAHRVIQTCAYLVCHISERDAFLENYRSGIMAMTISIATALLLEVFVYRSLEKIPYVRIRSRRQIGIATYLQCALLAIFLLAGTVVADRVWHINSTIAQDDYSDLLTSELNAIEKDVERTSAESKDGLLQLSEGVGDYQSNRNELLGLLVEDQKIGSTGGTVIVYDDEVIINTASEKEFEQADWFKKNKKFIQSQKENKLFVLSSDEKKGGYLAMYSKVQEYSVIVVISHNEAYRNTRTNYVLYVAMITVTFSILYLVFTMILDRVVIRKVAIFESGLKKISGGSLKERVDVRTSKEFSSLSDSINSTVDTLKQYIAEATARIDTELQMAKEIQLSTLPRNFGEYGAEANIDFYALMDTAKVVGGDFYDFYGRDGSNFYFLIADVSGKGIPAAMFMMRSKTALYEAMQGTASIEPAVAAANDYLCMENEKSMFVTAWQGSMDKSTGKVTFVSAGHNPPVLKRADGRTDFVTSPQNMALGVFEGNDYESAEIQLNTGDVLVLYTDGVTEAMNARGEFYGEERLLHLIRFSKNTQAKAICDELRSSLEEFAAGAEQFDDITILTVVRK